MAISTITSKGIDAYASIPASALQSTAQYTGFKNRIINGAMMIDQRNAGAIVTPSQTGYTYSVDRWSTYCTSTGKFSFQQNAGGVTPPSGFSKYLGFTSLAATSVASSDLYLFKQAIEGFNISDLGFGAAGASSVVFSFWVRSSITGTFGGSLNNGGNTRCYPFTFVVSSTNTWEQKFITVAGDTSGTWDTNNTSGLQLFFGLGVGSSFQGTANAWQNSAGGIFSATGATSVVGTNGATFQITGVQLEKGSTATSFDYRPYGTELALCQRYYQFVGGVASAGPFVQAYQVTGQTLTYSALFPVVMRASPTAVKNGTWVVANVNQPIPDFVSATGFSLRAVATATASTYFFPDSADDAVTFSAEL